LKEKSSAIIGAKNEQELLFIDRIKKSCADLWISTDDGSLGYKGMASDLAEKLLAEEKFDLVITCGPEKMMKELAMFCIKNGIKFQASLERWMKCGVGICGSCCIDGMRVCTDGPVFDGELLKNFEEFGNFKREPSGKKVRI
jgi:dihydroorotate dehydrogenase electron transfer subunit